MVMKEMSLFLGKKRYAVCYLFSNGSEKNLKLRKEKANMGKY